MVNRAEISDYLFNNFFGDLLKLHVQFSERKFAHRVYFMEDRLKQRHLRCFD
jgi:hypothetical protein